MPTRSQRKRANKKKYGTGGQYNVPHYEQGGGVASGQNDYFQHATLAGTYYGVPAGVLMSLFQAESSFNPGAVSSAGAVGLGQFMPGTWTEQVHRHPEIASHFGLSGNANERGNAEASIYMTAAYLHDLGYAQNPQGALNSYYGTSAPVSAYGGQTYAQHILAGAASYGGSGQPSQPTGPGSNPTLPNTGADNPTYTVQSGDSLSAIAARYPGITVGMLIYANAGRYPGLADNPNLIHPGDQFVIPLSALNGSNQPTNGSVSPPPTGGGGQPSLPATGSGGSGYGPNSSLIGQHVTIPGLGGGTIIADPSPGYGYLGPAFQPDNGGGVRSLEALGPTIEVLGANGQAITIDTASGTVLSSGDVPSSGGGGSDVGSVSNPSSSVSSSTSTSTSYNTSDVGPVSADIEREQNRIDNQRAIWQHEIDVVNADIARIGAYTDASSQNRLRGLEEQKFQYQQQLDALDWQDTLLQRAIQMRDQDVTLRGQDISVVMAQLDAQMQGRGQDVTQRGQDINAQLEGFNQQIQYWSEQRQAARDRNDATGVRDAEARMRAEMDNRNMLVQREQDIALRSQDIDAAVQYGQLLEDQYRQSVDFAKFTGDYQLQAHAQEQQHAAQQQNARLDQFKGQLDAHGQKLQAATSQAEADATLANMEQDWNKFLSEKAMNPRDFPQYFAAMGKGQQFMDALLSGHPFQGMTIGNIGETPLLSSPWAEQAFPDRTAWDRAMESSQKIGVLGNDVPEAPSWEEISQLGQVSPLAPPPALPEAPDLPNPMNMPRPDPINFVSPPPISDVAEVGPGPAAYTNADAMAEIAAWQAAHPNAKVGEVMAVRAAALAKVGSTQWDHFQVDTPRETPTNTAVVLPPAPAPVQGADLYTNADFTSEFNAWLAHDGWTPAAGMAHQLWIEHKKDELAAKIGKPKPQTSYMPVSSPFPDPVPSAPPIENIAPGAGAPAVPPGGSTTSPPSGSPPAAVSSHPPPGGSYTPPATTYHPPPTSVTPPHTTVTPPGHQPFQPTIPTGMQDKANTILSAADEWRRTHGHAFGGREQLVTEPVVAVGMHSGDPKFTLTEPTNGFPRGIPEKATLENPDASIIPGVPDGSAVDIEPFGQEPKTAAAGIIEDGRTRIKAGESAHSVIADMMAAFEAIMRNGREGGPNLDSWRIAHGGASPKETAYMAAAQPPGAAPPAGGDISPPQTPAPDFMAGLMSDVNTAMQGKKKLKNMAAMVAGRSK